MKKKKNIIPLNNIWLIYWFAILLFLCIIVGMSINLSIANRNNYLLIITVPLILLFIYRLIRMFFLRITFYDDYLFMPNDGILRKDRIMQYATKVYYNEIQRIEYIYDKRNSEGKEVKGGAFWSPWVFLEFTCVDDTKKRISIFQYSSRQCNKIIEMIKDRTGLTEDNISRMVTRT